VVMGNLSVRPKAVGVAANEKNIMMSVCRSNWIS